MAIPLLPGGSLPTVYSWVDYYIMTDGQSASLSWNKTSIWGLRPDLYYCMTVAGLLMWGALSGERTVLTFRITAGPRQRSHFWFRVPWDSWPYFTVSDSNLPFSSPPTLEGLRWRHSTPPSHGESILVRIRARATLRLAVYRQSVRLGAKLLETDGQIFFFYWTLACNSPYVTSLWREI
jgi:hypothetical protein